jgi:hypothetical protein
MVEVVDIEHKDYLHRFYTYFEHEMGCDGGSGDSGGIFIYLFLWLVSILE